MAQTVTGSHSAIQTLRAALGAIAPRVGTLTVHETAIVQARVYAAVDELKAVGMLPERVAIAITRIAVDAGFREGGHLLIDRITVWCVERCARSDEPSAAS